MFSFNILTIFALLLYVSCGLAMASKKEANCSLARETAEIVSSCPRTNEEWENAAARKNCENITQPCPKAYIYHCVINAWMNATVEVCAPIMVIVGNVCAEFNFGGDKIQRNSKASCKKCPDAYTSSNAFRYPECYEYVNRSKEISPSPKTTDAPITTAYFQSSSLSSSSSSSSSSNTTSNNSRDVREKNGSSQTESKISIVIGVSVPMAVVFVLIIFLVFRRIGRGPTSHGHSTLDVCTSITRKLLSNCNPTKQTTSEADSLAEQNGSVDTERITLTEETRLQPLTDHANV